jgi:hypothetical protein
MKAKAKKNPYVYSGEKIKVVSPKSLSKADEALKRHEELHQQFKDYIQPLYESAPRYPIYLTMEEISHIVLAVEYADVEKYCDNDILATINAKLGSALATHYLHQVL